ncbi:MAG: hypothetical protein ABIL76_00130 [candidate division WOR-3 bacterium]
MKAITKGAILNQFFLIFSAIPALCFYFLEIKNYLLFFIFLIFFLIFPLTLHFLSLKYEIKLNVFVFLKIFLMFLVLWFLVGFILSFSKSINLFYTILIFPIAYNIGILSLISPAGIGIREGVMTFMLLKFFDLEFSNKISVLFRIFNLIIELFLSLIAYILYKLDKLSRI